MAIAVECAAIFAEVVALLSQPPQEVSEAIRNALYTDLSDNESVTFEATTGLTFTKLVIPAAVRPLVSSPPASRTRNGSDEPFAANVVKALICPNASVL